MTDLNIAQNIAGALTGQGYKDVLEVGPGMGVLTQYLLQTDHVIHAIEVDDESITPVQVACNVLLSTRQVTDRLEGARSEGLHLDPVHRGQVDSS